MSVKYYQIVYWNNSIKEWKAIENVLYPSKDAVLGVLDYMRTVELTDKDLDFREVDTWSVEDIAYIEKRGKELFEEFTNNTPKHKNYKEDMNTKKARLDADKTAMPLSKIVSHAHEGDCIGPGIPLAGPEYRNSDGAVIKLSDVCEPEDFLTHLTEFAIRYKSNAYASRVVMSALRGECEHFGDGDVCEVCGVDLP